MPFLEWKDSYNIGVKEIDNQHRGLFDIISNFLRLGAVIFGKGSLPPLLL